MGEDVGEGTAELTSGLDRPPFLLQSGYGDWGIFRDVHGEGLPIALLPDNWQGVDLDPPNYRPPPPIPPI